MILRIFMTLIVVQMAIGYTFANGKTVVRVSDAVTGSPIEHAMLRIFDNVTFTDRHGVAEIQSGHYEVIIEKSGWMSASLSTVLRGEIEVALVREGLTQAQMELASRRIRDTSKRVALHMGSLETGLTASELPKTIDIVTPEGEVITLELEDYVKGVLPKEIGISFPMEAMKAQAVAARTYAVVYVTSKKKPICTTTTCQVWSPVHYPQTDAAVDATAGMVVTYMGKLVSTNYFASCGGHTLNSEDVWTNALPYLRGVPCIENKQGKCEVVCTRDHEADELCYGVFGHGVGMCQRGAQTMAMCGASFLDILHHYYTGVKIEPVEVSEPDPSGPEAVDEVSEGETEIEDVGDSQEEIVELKEVVVVETAYDGSVDQGPITVTANPLRSSSCQIGEPGQALGILLCGVLLLRFRRNFKRHA